ncbi:MAG: S1C family serine protease [Solirubrobacterales bacterium]
MRRPDHRGLLALLAALALALALSACGGSEDGGGQTTAADAAPNEELPEVFVQTQDGFNPQEVYERDAPSVVTVRSIFGSGNSEDPLGPGAMGGQGSGFVLSEDGEIVTNAHVVTDAQAAGGGADISPADEVYVDFSDRNQVEAEIVGFDPNADIALLKIDPKGLDLEPLELADSSKVEVGSPVAAIGSPFGQERSISIGIVSATGRAIDSLTDFAIDGGIQTDASINPGNSGGPLLDPEGRVIGVNQQINTTDGGNEGVGFAVPSNLVKRSIEDLRDDGEASYAYIGVSTIPLYPQLASELDIDFPTGSLIQRVVPDSPAGKAGLKGPGDQTIDFQGLEVGVGGDVIVAIDGTELVGESDLSRLIAEKRPGDEIEVEIIRDGDRKTIDVTLEERPSSFEDDDEEG